MAKKQVPSADTVEIRPKDLAKALEGIAQSIHAVRHLVLKLDPDITLTFTVSKAEPLAFLWDTSCAPPIRRSFHDREGAG